MEIKWLRLENTKNALFCPFLDFKVPKRTKKEASPDHLEPLPNPPIKGGNVHFFLIKSGFGKVRKTPCLDLDKNNKNSHFNMCRTNCPCKIQGNYFSLWASSQIKMSTSLLCLLQSHHILREQKHRLFKPKKQPLPDPLWASPWPSHQGRENI